MDVESDDDEYVDAIVYDDINDDDLRINVTNSCKPLSMYFVFVIVADELIKYTFHHGLECIVRV